MAKRRKRPETPRAAKREFAGSVQKSRRVKVPPAEIPKKSKQIAKFKSTGHLTVGRAMEAAGVFKKIRAIPIGTRVKITARGRLTRQRKDRPFAQRVFILGFGKEGQRLSHPNQIMFHMMGALGKDFFELRGRGYDMIDPNDKIEWRVSILAPKEPEKPKKRRKKAKKKVSVKSRKKVPKRVKRKSRAQAAIGSGKTTSKRSKKSKRRKSSGKPKRKTRGRG